MGEGVGTERVKVDFEVIPEGAKGVALLVPAGLLRLLMGEALALSGAGWPAIPKVLEEVLHRNGAVIGLDWPQLEEIREGGELDLGVVGRVGDEGRDDEGPVQGLGKGHGSKEVLRLVPESPHAQAEQQVSTLIPLRCG